MRYQIVKPHPLGGTLNSLLKSSHVLTRATETLIKDVTIIPISRPFRQNPECGLSEYRFNTYAIALYQAA
jgi:hypothetical protein